MTIPNEIIEDEYNPQILEPNDDFEDRIASILGQVNDDDNIRITLYKKSKFGKLAICDSLEAEQIDYHAIGTKHGKGDFRIYIKWKRPNEKTWHTRNYNFSVDDYYEKVKVENEKKELLHNLSPVNNNSSVEMMSMMMQMMTLNMNAMQQAATQQSQQFMGFMQIMMQNKPDNNNDALLAFIMDDKREERKQGHEIFLKGLEMGTQQQQLDAESNETSWKDVACTIIENADKILSPFFSGMIKDQMQKPEYADLMKNDEFMNFVKGGIEETHPEKSGKILEQINQLQG